jgi:hypothetical protein
VGYGSPVVLKQLVPERKDRISINAMIDEREC